MPCRETPLVPGQFYHVTNRGALRFALFLDPVMYWLFIQLVEVYAQKHKITVAAICLMPNHYHILVRIDEGGNLSDFIKSVCGVYSQKVNRYHKRKGTIFQGRFFCKHVCDDDYFKQVSAYIHVNPFKAALCIHPSEWSYSNYLECVGERNDIKVDNQLIPKHFKGKHKYAEYVEVEMQRVFVRNPQLLKDLSDMGLI